MLSPPLIKTLPLHRYEIHQIAFSLDGRMLASGGCPRDYTIRILDTETWGQIHGLRGHKDRITGLAFSPDGTLLASSSADKTVKLWDLKTGELRGTIAGHRKVVFRVVWAPDGRTLVSCGLDNCVIVTDVATCAEIRRWGPAKSYVYAVNYSPDGASIGIASWSERFASDVCLWNPSSGDEKWLPGAHRDNPLWLAWSKDGETIGSATYGDVILRDAQSGAPKVRLQSPARATVTFSFSPDGRLLADGGRISRVRPDGNLDHNERLGLIQIWDTFTGRLKTEFIAHEKDVYSVAFSPEAKFLASGSLDGTVKIWDAANLVEDENAAPAREDTSPVTFGIHAYCHTSVGSVTAQELTQGIAERLRSLSNLFCPVNEEDPDKVVQRLTVEDKCGSGNFSTFAISYRAHSRSSIAIERIEDPRVSIPHRELMDLASNRKDEPNAAEIRRLLLGTKERVSFSLTKDDVDGMGFPAAIAAANFLVAKAGGIVQSGIFSWMVPEGKEVRILGEWKEMEIHVHRW